MNTTAIIRRPPSTFHCMLHITIAATLLFLTTIKATTIETTQQECYTDENGLCSNDDHQEHLLCRDLLPECVEYASNEEDDPCVYTSYFMYHNCPKSCGACEYAVYLDYYNEVVSSLRSDCFDDDENCEDWADAGECEGNPEFMIDSCRESCNVCVATDEEMGNVEQRLFEDDEELHKAIMEHSERMEEYFEKKVLIDPFYDNVRSKCVNLNSECLYWAVTGECEPEPDKHYAYMMGNCPLACLSCEMVDVKNRCPLPENEAEVNAYGPGDLDNMFRGIADGNWDQYSPVIHSAPSDYFKRKNKKSKVDDSNVKLGGPWIVTFENFLTELEAAQMIVLGYEQGFERSTDVGSMKLDGSYTNSESTGRTSENAWCTDECDEHITAKTISQRIVNVTKIPIPNSEHLQILRYRSDQFYESHHDFIDHHVERPCGPRILTFFLYLSDVQSGGGTLFNELDITIMPKVGRALLWPSVLSENLNKKDFRTDHEALPVVEGTKFAANAWLHLRDFRGWVDRGCA